MIDEFENLEYRISAARKVKKKSAQKQDMQDEDVGREGLHAGIEFVASVFIPALIGWKLDEWLGTSPGFFLGLLFLGVLGGFYSVYKISQGLGSAVGTSPLPEDEKNAKTPSNDG